MLTKTLSENRSKPLISLEVNPPRGIETATSLERASSVAHLVDFFETTDCALAKLKMSGLAYGALLTRATGKPVVANLSCRDRNLLGLESEALGAHALGVAGLIALTGDGMGVGDRPRAKAVFEVNSIALLKALSSLLAGIDTTGTALAGAPQLVLGCVANPHCANQDAELRKLERKREAGATLLLTQPVYDAEATVEFFAAASSMGFTTLAGLLPFKTVAGARRALTIPGVKAPAQRYEQRSDGEDIAMETLSECVATAQALRSVVAGYHVIAGATPSLSVQLVPLLREALG